MKDLYYQRKEDTFQFHIMNLWDKEGGAYLLIFTRMVGQLPKSSDQGARVNPPIYQAYKLLKSLLT